MAEGLLKKELEDKKIVLTEYIDELEIEEKANSTILHTAKSEKERLRKLIIGAKNKMTLYDKFIEECHPIKTTASITI